MKPQTLIAGIALLAPACALALGEQAAREWAEDIAYFQDALEDKHINLYHSIDKSVLDRLLSELTGRLPELNKHQSPSTPPIF